jgi:hypothetical protein
MSALALPTSSFCIPFQGLETAMRQTTRVTFAMRDFDRLKCIKAVVDGDLKPFRAAERLGLTTRQVRRLARRCAAAGPAGLISRRFSRPSNNRLDDAKADQAIKQSTYADFGPTLAGRSCPKERPTIRTCGDIHKRPEWRPTSMRSRFQTSCA